MLAVIGGGGLVFSLLMGFMVAGGIRKTVIEVTQAAEKIRNEGAHVEVGFSGSNELSEMAKSFNKVIHHLRENPPVSQDQHESTNDTRDRELQLTQQFEAEKRQLEASLNQMIEAMVRLSEGDLTIQLDPVSDPSLSGLFDGFNHVVTRMNNTIMDVQKAVAGTTSVAQAIKLRSSSLSSSSSQISGQTTDVAAATEEMATSIVDNAHNASATAEVSENIGEVAKRGKGVVEQTITKINEIASAVEESSKVVQLLSKSSEQIGDIVLVIDEIADQTNLLASECGY